jgi:putative endonuclease
MHYVYVLRCGDGTLYTGYTTDVARRLAEHRNGTGAKYTRGRQPLTLRRVERFETRSAAQSREHAIKQLSRAEKDGLLPDRDDRVAVGGRLAV